MTDASPLVLLIEDDPTLAGSLVQRLRLENFRVEWAARARQAGELLAKVRPDVIVSDIRLPDGDGETLMREHFAGAGLVPIIFMTAYGDIDQAVRLVRAGAHDYLTKPFEVDDLVARLRELAAVRHRTAQTSLSVVSDAMAEVDRVLHRAAPSELPILLLGETGTGKEVAARRIHADSHRRDHPFVAVNCGALPLDLADSLLFGHEKGAFTGSIGSHRGYFEEAETGTLFLDEVADLPLQQQVRLLRVIEEQSFRRLGGTATVSFRARIVSATNRDIAMMVREGAFREDLWYRLNVITCRLPPLRARGDDGLALARQFLTSVAKRNGATGQALSPGAVTAIKRHAWPGNVRELLNRIERAFVLSEEATLEEADLFPDGVKDLTSGEETPFEATLAHVRESAERDHIQRALEANAGMIAETARQLGISRTTLWEKMRRYRLSLDEE
ncbi:sigma-54-dependent transcriptional regulator [Pararhizobium haloflavum]|uniref:sigma-54-dependent transcriptional regulator n=1 Tax=Pararhizobium haloflavum TaxID=2037914 RepID=UPI000C18519E|nr:sigma-54 dependent transcriptional regulator [Pararhizobium haloflavum]